MFQTTSIFIQYENKFSVFFFLLFQFISSILMGICKEEERPTVLVINLCVATSLGPRPRMTKGMNLNKVSFIGKFSAQ